MPGQPQHVVVAGDVTIDWNVARVRKTTQQVLTWNAEDAMRASWQWGGAALLADVVAGVVQRLNREKGTAYTVARPDPREQPRCPEDERFHHSYAMWVPVETGAHGKDRAQTVWRVDEFLGFDEAGGRSEGDRIGGKVPRAAAPLLRLSADPPRAALAVLDDAGLGFRDRRSAWPRALWDETHPGWVLCKMASPVALGSLWDRLVQRRSDHLVVVMEVNDLRRTEVHVSRGLSWERTAQDVFWELTRNPRVNALSRCRHVVVSFGPSGALLLSRRDPAHGPDGPPQWECTIFFDTRETEGMWGEVIRGRVLGYTTCLAGAIAREMLLEPEAPDLEAGLRSGVGVMRQLLEDGYGSHTSGKPLEGLRFPMDMVVPRIGQPPHSRLSSSRVPSPVGLERAYAYDAYWSILDDKCAGPPHEKGDTIGTIHKVARLIVKHGPEATLKDVPLGRFGKLVTADRREVEGLSSIRALIAGYCQSSLKSPLSIAVFGPPGSGKSFGVRQVAASIPVPAEIKEIKECTFNLSQFSGPDQIVDALHQVRDIAISGRMPLVFWDEFDTRLADQELGWLRYFLAPMQDGRFQDKQITHEIGRSIFVFAGGTCASMSDFVDRLKDPMAVRAKAPDFVSRLRGFVDILGPNAHPDPHVDPRYLIRRAVILSNVLRDNARDLFREDGTLGIDPGVLRAFLHTPVYRHGVRSMEAVVGMSSLAGRRSYERSCLPAERQLDLHVDGPGFLDLVQRPDLDDLEDEDVLEVLAKGVHEAYRKRHPERGVPPYRDLSPQLQEDNRAHVRDIVNRLAAAGFRVMPAQGKGRTRFSRDDIGWLARLEHERWLRERRAAGWRWGPGDTNKQAKTNASMLPWSKLTEPQKKDNYDSIRDLPGILQRAGYTAERVTPLAEVRQYLDHQREDAKLRVGVVGHRFLGSVSRLEAALNAALDRVETAFPERRLVAMSALPEGAARLGAEAVLRRAGAGLIVALPLDREEFAKDFQSEASKAHFAFLLDRASEVLEAPRRPTRAEAYESADSYVVDESDVLMALWDGEPARGLGGTALSVDRAVAQGMPVIHIIVAGRSLAADDSAAPSIDHGRIRTCNFPGAEKGRWLDIA